MDLPSASLLSIQGIYLPTSDSGLRDPECRVREISVRALTDEGFSSVEEPPNFNPFTGIFASGRPWDGILINGAAFALSFEHKDYKFRNF
jgi:hypothetical protein